MTITIWRFGGAVRFGTAPKPPVFSHAQVKMLIANSHNDILVVA